MRRASKTTKPSGCRAGSATGSHRAVQAECSATGAWILGWRRRIISGSVAALWLAAATSLAVDVAGVRKLLDEKKYPEAIELLVQETRENPAHETARIWLAEAYEASGQSDEAIAAWEALMAVSRFEPNLQKARKALSRLRRQRLDEQDLADLSARFERTDPFNIPMPPIDWEGLEVIEDTKYLPAIPRHEFEVPPFIYQTKHFTVYSANERLSKVIGEQAEAYLSFMIDKLFSGQAWALRFPIIVYTTESDYQQHGGAAGTGGVTHRHITGKTEKILLYQLTSTSSGGARGRGRAAGGGIWKYGIESVLPHELTHAVINEFFAGRPTPQWLHEAIAGRFERTRDHYGEAARLARKVVVGEYFRMQDLFAQQGYPERMGLFYEQSAAVVLYLFETGPEAMHAFLAELAAGNGHDAACAAALGISEENAVEVFERKWVEWMKARYIRDLDRASDDTQTAEASKSASRIFLPRVNETDTVALIQEWRKIELDSLTAFQPVGGSLDEWLVEDGLLQRRVLDQGAESSSALLAVRMREKPPAVIRCKIRCPAGPEEKNRWFGFAQLDANLTDTRVEVLAPLRDIEEHELVFIWSDDLALYLGGTCVGRYPAATIAAENVPDVEYPLALVAYGPVQIRELYVAPIKAFSDQPVVTAVQEQPRDRGQRSSERRPSERRGRRKGSGP